MLRILLSVVIGYLLGSINIGIILSKCLLKTDVREKGSHNAGATNVARVFGMKMGAVTLFGDFLKTLAANFLGGLLYGDVGACVAVGACLTGHCWPLYFGFKGGKGVATGACVALIIDWRVFVVVIGVFIIAVAVTKIVSVSSLLAAISLPTSILIFGDIGTPYVILGFFTAALVWIMHRSNIKRILDGTEQKFKPGSGK